MKNNQLAKLLIEGTDRPSKADITADAEKSLSDNYGPGDWGATQIRGWASSIVSQKSSTDTKKASMARRAEQTLKSWDRDEEAAVAKLNGANADSPNLKSLASAVVAVKKKYASQLTSIFKQWGN